MMCRQYSGNRADEHADFNVEINDLVLLSAKNEHKFDFASRLFVLAAKSKLENDNILLLEHIAHTLNRWER